MASFNIKKNDMVKVIRGKEKGKTGKVLSVLAEGKVVVEKVNMIKRHQKANPRTGQGGIVEKEAPMAISKVMLLCPKSGKPTRVGHKILADGTKVRIAIKSKEQLA